MWCGAFVCDEYIDKVTPGDFGCRATGTTGVSACVGRWSSFGGSLGRRKRGKGGSVDPPTSLPPCFALLCFAFFFFFCISCRRIEKYASCAFAFVYCGQAFVGQHVCLPGSCFVFCTCVHGPVFRSIQGGVWAWAYDVTPLQASLSPTRLRPQRSMRGHRVVESERAFAVHRFFCFVFFSFFFARIF